MLRLHDSKQGKFGQWIIWVSFLILIDQTSKFIIRRTMLPGSRLPFIDNILFLNLVPNYHGYSWFVPDLPDWLGPFFIAIRLAILVMVFPVYDFYTRSKRGSIWASIALICLSSGIAGNLLDDLFFLLCNGFHPGISFALRKPG